MKTKIIKENGENSKEEKSEKSKVFVAHRILRT